MVRDKKRKNAYTVLTHWGRATHICVSKLIIIASDNGLSPGRCQAIIWNNAGILSVGLLGTNFSEILHLQWNSDIFFQENALESVVCEMAAMLSWPQCVFVFPLPLSPTWMITSVVYCIRILFIHALSPTAVYFIRYIYLHVVTYPHKKSASLRQSVSNRAHWDISGMICGQCWIIR